MARENMSSEDAVGKSAATDARFSLPLPTSVDGEPRIRDLDLAARLEFSDPHKIRQLIARYSIALAALGISATVAEIPRGRGRPGKAYYLNRRQAIFITAKSETPKATEITIEIVERFDAYERGLMHSTNSPVNMRDPAQLAQAAMQLVEINRELTQRVERADATITVLTPRGQFADEIAQRQGELSVDEVAKLLLRWSGNRLFSWLRNAGWIDRRDGMNTPRMWALERGLMVVRPITLRDGRLYSQPMITPRGLEVLRHHVRAGDLFLAASAIRQLSAQGEISTRPD
jgi:phage antirepressor YoqD-like protein